MSDYSGLSGKVVSRKGGQRYMVHWRARLFMADKVIHPAVISSVFKTGFALEFHHAVPLGTEMNVEFAVTFRGENHRIRVKGKVDYCLLRSSGDAVDMDIITTKIDRKDHHLLGNVLQTLEEAKSFNLRN